MAGSNATTRFELFFLILWLAVTFALLALAVLRKLQLPNFIRGDKNMTAVFAFLQLVIFVLLLSALAVDQWSKASFFRYEINYGVVRAHGTGGSNEYKCSNVGSDYKTPCGTIVAAGVFTLIFGLVAIFTAAALLAIVLCSFFGVSQFDPAKPFVSVLANIQWISLTAMVLLWGVSAHDVMRSSELMTVDRLGDSWILCLVTTILAVGVAFFFAGGAGESYKGGEASAPATSAGPAQPTGVTTAPQTAVAYPSYAQQQAVV